MFSSLVKRLDFNCVQYNIGGRWRNRSMSSSLTFVKTVLAVILDAMPSSMSTIRLLVAIAFTSSWLSLEHGYSNGELSELGSLF